MMVWYSYVYNTEYQNQRRIVKQLAPNIKDWLNWGLINGFNYNYITTIPTISLLD